MSKQVPSKYRLFLILNFALNRMFSARRFTSRVVSQIKNRRNFGAGPVSEPHESTFHKNLGKFMLVSTYLWIFYRVKEDNGQLFGLYQPWLHPHEHSHHKYEYGETMATIPTPVEHHHDDDEE